MENDALSGKLDKIVNNIGKISIDVGVQAEKIKNIETRMSDGQDRAKSAENTLRQQHIQLGEKFESGCNRIVKLLDKKANERDCKERFDHVKTENNKNKKLTRIIVIALCSGVFGTSVAMSTNGGQNFINKLLKLIVGGIL